ncbi:hypothetical protein F5Y15DRAFT_372090 [Xylariaceae sp. FL0016]|nr:hypothetical protein F5Y15DRAFT_372090 [Xylariaceae sp. FL0016]
MDTFPHHHSSTLRLSQMTRDLHILIRHPYSELGCPPCTTDITGLGTLLQIWASCCRSGSSQDVGFDAESIGREPLKVAGATPRTSRPVPEVLHVPTPHDMARMTGPKPGHYVTSVVFLPDTNVQDLKIAVNDHLAAQRPGFWVSTHDVLTTLLWAAVLGAKPAPPDPSASANPTSTNRLPGQLPQQAPSAPTAGVPRRRLCHDERQRRTRRHALHLPWPALDRSDLQHLCGGPHGREPR